MDRNEKVLKIPISGRGDDQARIIRGLAVIARGYERV